MTEKNEAVMKVARAAVAKQYEDIGLPGVSDAIRAGNEDHTSDIQHAYLGALAMQEGMADAAVAPAKELNIDALARDCAVAAIDGIYGYTVEFAPSYDQHAQEYDVAEQAIFRELTRALTHPSPSAPDAVAVKAKPLIWRQGYSDEICSILQASNGWLYQVRTLHGEHWLDWPDRQESIKYDTIEDAKVAAQADYERRILSALTTGGGNG